MAIHKHTLQLLPRRGLNWHLITLPVGPGCCFIVSYRHRWCPRVWAGKQSFNWKVSSHSLPLAPYWPSMQLNFAHLQKIDATVIIQQKVHKKKRYHHPLIGFSLNEVKEIRKWLQIKNTKYLMSLNSLMINIFLSSPGCSKGNNLQCPKVTTAELVEASVVWFTPVCIFLQMMVIKHILLVSCAWAVGQMFHHLFAFTNLIQLRSWEWPFTYLQNRIAFVT